MKKPHRGGAASADASQRLLLVLLLVLLGLGRRGRPGPPPRRGAAASSSTRGGLADTITGFSVPCFTTLMPSGSFRSLTCSDWPLTRWPRSMVMNSGSCEARHSISSSVSTWLTRHLSVLTADRVLFVDEVQRHLLVQPGGLVHALEVDVQDDLACTGASGSRAAAPSASCRPVPSRGSRSGRLPSSARRTARCDRARSWRACRRRRRCRAPCRRCAGGGSLRSPAACARMRRISWFHSKCEGARDQVA